MTLPVSMHMEAMRHPITPQDNEQHGLLRAHCSLRGSQRAHPGRFVRTLRHCALLRAAASHTACAPRARECVPRCGNPPEIVQAAVAEGTQVVPEERRITPFAPAACVLWIERVHF
jgi:hypothetical protein